jgi:reactive intermediate/imine deaminase
MSKTAIRTPNAPAAIGTYSQAIRAGDTVYLSGQIGLDPITGELASGIDAQIERVFQNLEAVAVAAEGGLEHVVRLTVYLTDLGHFAKVNEAMARHFREPYPARAAVGVASLPRAASIEVDAIMHTGRERLHVDRN